MFIRKRVLVLKYIKRYENLKLKKQNYAGNLATTVNRILNKKNEVYTFFYTIKFKRQNIGMGVLN
jgi:hypothetical protein